MFKPNKTSKANLILSILSVSSDADGISYVLLITWSYSWPLSVQFRKGQVEASAMQ